MDSAHSGPRPIGEVVAEIAADARRRHKYRRLLDRIVDEKAPRLFIEVLTDLGRQHQCDADIEALVDHFLNVDLNLLDQQPHGRDIAARHIRVTDNGS